MPTDQVVGWSTDWGPPDQHCTSAEGSLDVTPDVTGPGYTLLHDVTRFDQTGNLGIWFEAWSHNILSWFSCFSEIRRCAIAPSDRCLQRKRPCDTSAGGSNSLVDTRGYQPCTICGQFRKDWIWIDCWHLFTVFHVSEMLSRCFGKKHVFKLWLATFSQGFTKPTSPTLKRTQIMPC